jgi:hypothetical protein
MVSTLIDFGHTHSDPKPLTPYIYISQNHCLGSGLAAIENSGKPHCVYQEMPSLEEEQAKREFILGARVALSAPQTSDHTVWVLTRRLNSSYRRSMVLVVRALFRWPGESLLIVKNRSPASSRPVATLLCREGHLLIMDVPGHVRGKLRYFVHCATPRWHIASHRRQRRIRA